MKTVYEVMEEANAQQNIKNFIELQKLPYEQKIRHAREVSWSFFNEAKKRGYKVHLSIGGLDSITLHYFLESIGIYVPCVSVSSIEPKGVRAVHQKIKSEMDENYSSWFSDHGALEQKQIDEIEDSELKAQEQHLHDCAGAKPEMIFLKPLKSKVEILNEFGWPVLSKEIAGKVALLQNPTAKNATVRHAIITGETGAYGGFKTGSRMKLSQRWLEKFGGADPEGRSLGYQKSPYKVSDRCCYYLKERPCDDYARQNNSVPFLGLMASEGGRRQKALMLHGCNYFGKSTIRSCPFAIFSRNDLLRLALELSVPVPEEYGEIEELPDGSLRTTKAQRTGCTMCGFGIHLEKRPHRFDLLARENPQEWDFWMNRACKDDKGNPYGWGAVLDYIGVEWRPDEQLSLFEK